MTRDLPSLNALRMFEAAARYQNFTRAAERLFVTQGAVSRQVKHLEDELGCKLFKRDGPRLQLTAEGSQLFLSVSEGLATIRRGTRDLRRELATPTLTISVLPSFAATWLARRIHRIHERLEKVEVRIASSYEPVNFDHQPDIDAAIRWGLGHWPNTYTERLLTERLFPVCSPAFIEQHQEPQSADDLAKLPLIRPTDEFDRWEEWFHAAGAVAPAASEKLRTTDALLIQQAALDGRGVALGRSLLVDEDLKAGRLVRLLDTSIASEKSFYFVCPSRMQDSEPLSTLLEWLRKEAETSEHVH